MKPIEYIRKGHVIFTLKANGVIDEALTKHFHSINAAKRESRRLQSQLGARLAVIK